MMKYLIFVPFGILLLFVVLYWIGAAGCLRQKDDPCQHWKEVLWTCQESGEVCSEAFWKQEALKRKYRKELKQLKETMKQWHPAHIQVHSDEACEGYKCWQEETDAD
jgi:hypothetical protein